MDNTFPVYENGGMEEDFTAAYGHRRIQDSVGLEEDINFSVASHVIHWGSWLIPRRDWASGIRDFVEARRQG